MDKIGTSIENLVKDKYDINCSDFLKFLDIINEEHKNIKLGGGAIAIEKQHDKKRLTARERIDHLIDSGGTFF